MEETTLNHDKMEELKEFDKSKIGVKGLSDSGITSIPRFFIHPPETLTDVKKSSSSSTSTISIPIIDLSQMNSPSHRPKLVDQIRDAAASWGFFQVINHGVPASVLDDTVSSVRAFHDLPFEVKSKYYKREERRGVMFTSNHNLYRASAACWRDTLQAWLGPEPLEAAEIPEVCREEVIAWDSHATAVVERVMELLSEGLGLESGKFKELTFSESKLLVGHCYPYCPQPDLTFGAESHTDAGILAILLQNQVPGLQVKHGDVWVDVEPPLQGLIVNVGDILQIISNGAYTSVQHRVLANSSKGPRISIAMFFNLAKWKGDGYCGPLPELLSPEKPRIYRDFTQKEFLENYYNKARGVKSLIEEIKIHH